MNVTWFPKHPLQPILATPNIQSHIHANAVWCSISYVLHILYIKKWPVTSGEKNKDFYNQNSWKATSKMERKLETCHVFSKWQSVTPCITPLHRKLHYKCTGLYSYLLHMQSAAKLTTAVAHESKFTVPTVHVHDHITSCRQADTDYITLLHYINIIWGSDAVNTPRQHQGHKVTVTTSGNNICGQGAGVIWVNIPSRNGNMYHTHNIINKIFVLIFILNISNC